MYDAVFVLVEAFNKILRKKPDQFRNNIRRGQTLMAAAAASSSNMSGLTMANAANSANANGPMGVAGGGSSGGGGGGMLSGSSNGIGNHGNGGGLGGSGLGIGGGGGGGGGMGGLGVGGGGGGIGNGGLNGLGGSGPAGGSSSGMQSNSNSNSPSRALDCNTSKGWVNPWEHGDKISRYLRKVTAITQTDDIQYINIAYRYHNSCTHMYISFPVILFPFQRYFALQHRILDFGPLPSIFYLLH